jgi:hypothetical protein
MLMLSWAYLPSTILIVTLGVSLRGLAAEECNI